MGLAPVVFCKIPIIGPRYYGAHTPDHSHCVPARPALGSPAPIPWAAIKPVHRDFPFPGTPVCLRRVGSEVVGLADVTSPELWTDYGRAGARNKGFEGLHPVAVAGKKNAEVKLNSQSGCSST
ncbi:hypothetical protein VUR80DRAFT_7610 [Thermomyces stellatus]